MIIEYNKTNLYFRLAVSIRIDYASILNINLKDLINNLTIVMSNNDTLLTSY